MSVPRNCPTHVSDVHDNKHELTHGFPRPFYHCSLPSALPFLTPLFSLWQAFGLGWLSWCTVSILSRHPPAPTASSAHHSFLDEQFPPFIKRIFVNSTDATWPRSQINMIIQTTLYLIVHNSGNSIMFLWQQQHKPRLGQQTLFSDVWETALHAFT